jgi:hypothetical protein
VQQNITDGTNIYLYGNWSTINGVTMYGFAAVNTSGSLVSSNKLHFSSYGLNSWVTSNRAMQLVAGGVLRLGTGTLNSKKVWDTRYKVARN